MNLSNLSKNLPHGVYNSNNFSSTYNTKHYNTLKMILMVYLIYRFYCSFGDVPLLKNQLEMVLHVTFDINSLSTQTMLIRPRQSCECPHHHPHPLPVTKTPGTANDYTTLQKYYFNQLTIINQLTKGFKLLSLTALIRI